MEPAISYWETYKAKGDDKMILKCIDSGSKGNAYALIAKEEILLLEAGCRLMDVKKAIGFQIGKVVGCLVTHSHKDHIGYAKDILATGIKIYTNDETKQLVDSVHGERLYGKPEMKMFEAGDFKVKPFYVPHNGTPNYAYLIEHEEMGKLLFATDFEYLPWTFRQQRLNHMLIGVTIWTMWRTRMRTLNTLCVDTAVYQRYLMLFVKTKHRVCVTSYYAI